MEPEDRAKFMEALRAELLDDPAGRGYAEARSHAERADLLNEPYNEQVANPRAGRVATRDLEAALMRPSVARVGATDYTVWHIVDAAKKRERNPVTGEAFDAKSAAALRSVAGFLDRHDEVNLADADVQGILGGLVQAGILSEAQATAIGQLGAPASLPEPRLARVVEVVLGIAGAPNQVAAADVAEALA